MSFFDHQRASPGSYLPFSTNPEPKVEELREGLNKSMSDKYIILPLGDFLSHFTIDVTEDMPECDFSSVPTSGAEKKIYRPLCDILNKSGICPKIRFVDTHAGMHLGENSQQKIDVGGYPAQYAPQQGGHVDWGHMLVSVEIKPKWATCDPFGDDASVPAPSAEERTKVRGQLLSYTSLGFLHGQRTFHFTILILGAYARLIRWDRAGAVVSERFLYQSEKGFLTFLWRIGHASDEQCGLDPTAVVLNKDDDDYKMMDKYAKDEEKLAEGDYARKLFAKTLAEGWIRWRVTVHQDGQDHVFLIAKPHFHAPELVGRGTRGSIALNKAGVKDPLTRFAYLKEAWRVVDAVDDQAQRREGDTLRILADHNVPYIPTPICDGDVGDQRTRSHEFWKGEGKCPMRIHRHYRMAVKEVCLPLSAFRRGIELVMAIGHCIHAHEEACIKAKILHRDVSAGNILLLPIERVDPDGTRWIFYQGMLNDWELSRTIENVEVGVAADRTGTWQFMSVRCSDDPSASIMIDDELESFFNVLLYYALRHLPSNCRDVTSFMTQYFDAYDRRVNVTRANNYKSRCIAEGFIPLAEAGTQLCFALPEGSDEGQGQGPTAEDGSQDEDDDEPPAHPINDIISGMLSWLHARYALISHFNRRRAQVAAAPNMDVLAKDARLLETGYNFLVTGNAPAPPVHRGARLTPAQVVQLKREAENLKTHAPVKMLLREVLNGVVWPDGDRLPDRVKAESIKRVEDAAAKWAAATERKYGTSASPQVVPATPSSQTPAGSGVDPATSSAQTRHSVGSKRTGGHLDEDAREEESAPKRGRVD